MKTIIIMITKSKNFPKKKNSNNEFDIRYFIRYISSREIRHGSFANVVPSDKKKVKSFVYFLNILFSDKLLLFCFLNALRIEEQLTDAKCSRKFF